MELTDSLLCPPCSAWASLGPGGQRHFMPGPEASVGPQRRPSLSPPPLGSSGTASPPGGGNAGDRGKDWPLRSLPISCTPPALHEGTEVTSSVGHWAPRTREQARSHL